MAVTDMGTVMGMGMGSGAVMGTVMGMGMAEVGAGGTAGGGDMAEAHVGGGHRLAIFGVAATKPWSKMGVGFGRRPISISSLKLCRVASPCIRLVSEFPSQSFTARCQDRWKH